MRDKTPQIGAAEGSQARQSLDAVPQGILECHLLRESEKKSIRLYSWTSKAASPDGTCSVHRTSEPGMHSRDYTASPFSSRFRT